ncbi:HelD family protein [Perlabentimonas gracilis]|uniref:HelD family protein n=1 Tax=Perlabentimonas gracilis TaxID=2715279 RepID=UPI0014080396|nr:UvrD-helicase domain-containing protein [Perlabentimonas gracilis]NHB70408.1 AAA family ATPase [Perlabentimonas gracilis]
MTEEKREKEYLLNLLKKVDLKLFEINEAIQLKSDEVASMNKHMQDHKTDMDHLEKNNMREAILNFSLQGEHSVEHRKRLTRLKDTAYFGRIDFRENQLNDSKKIYVGVHNFQDTESNNNLVYDWRAPISSLFYDFELGEGYYETPLGVIKGDISLKRQFRIRKGTMEYMLDTDVTIHDEVLQKELNQTSSAKMKNIVATIQKEQNAIIRNEEARHLIIQGVAGSGKTSIALHRIAFLLYRFKDSISSEDILIISPNKVFANYISNVLPELGEESVAETSMEEIANEILEYQVNFQSFFEQVAELLDKNDAKLIERIQFKSSSQILNKLDEYVTYLENEGFKITDITVKSKPVPAWFIRESFDKYQRMPLLKRFNEVVREIVDNIFRHYGLEIQYKDRTNLHNTIRKMFPSYNPRMLYKGFYDWLGKTELLKTKAGNTYEWSDVYAFIYLKYRLEGMKSNAKVKHLVIDEMQDYSVVQYKVLSLLFPCKKTILGDVNQSVNPFSSSNLPIIENVFSGATTMTMLKSYRSTYEITQFTKRISQKVNVEAIERYGEEPQIFSCKNTKDETDKIKSLISQFKQSEYNSLGIICKTQKQADTLFEALKNEHEINLLNAVSVAFGSGIVITTAHLAKGLEFDQVIVPFCTEKNYKTEPDKQMLYVGCTRAMHKLSLTHTEKASQLIAS